VTRRLLPAALAALSLGLLACGSSDSSSTSTSAAGTAATTASTQASTPTASTTTDAAATSPAGCKTVKAQEPVERKGTKPTTTLPASKTSVVTLRTSCGDIEITLDVKEHPKTASSFGALAESGFYDGLGVVRVVPEFVLQAGDPNGDGTGDAGYQITEAPGNNAAYRKGVVAMAKTGADPAGASSSQFFIVTGPDAGLPPEYAIAGRVTKGQDVADRIGAIPPENGQDGPPTTPVIIEKATLSTK
jgi:cyclophilin family peptidyl-prolyl cis-trans isomerase